MHTRTHMDTHTHNLTHKVTYTNRCSGMKSHVYTYLNCKHQIQRMTCNLKENLESLRASYASPHKCGQFMHSLCSLPHLRLCRLPLHQSLFNYLWHHDWWCHQTQVQTLKVHPHRYDKRRHPKFWAWGTLDLCWIP